MKSSQLWKDLIIVLLVLHEADGQTRDRSNGEGPIASTEDPPWVPVLESRHCKKILKCPDSDDIREYRVGCFGNPQRGHLYHCGVTENRDRVVEFYYRKFPCSRGFYGIPHFQEKFVKMACKKCPKDRFNPHKRFSPENMDECRAHFHMARDRHAIQYLPGNSIDPEISYCDYIDGYASANKQMFCEEAYKPCRCSFVLETCSGLELLPDGSCEQWCDGHRSPKANFSCLPGPLTTTRRIGNISESTVPRTNFTTSSKEEISVDESGRPTKPVTRPPFTEVNRLGVVTAIVVTILVGIVVTLLVVVDKKMNLSRNYYTNIYNVARGHFFRLRGNENTVNL